MLDCSAGFGCKKVYIIIFMLQFAQQNSKRTKLSQNSTRFKFIFLLPGNCNDYENEFLQKENII